MSTDSDLQQDVLAELSWEPSIVAAHIGVTANAGVVTLTGHVDTFAQKHEAEAATRRVKGVKAVAQEIDVRLSFEMKRTDDEIAAAAIDRLAWNVSVPRDALKVAVERGWITLTGHVEWYFQKAAAEQDVSRLYGVIGVSNQVTIKPHGRPANISDDITHALHRSWFFDPRMVTVTRDGGQVRLSGSVHSPHDRQIAAATAWASPGVTSVVNDVEVG
jgi:osmotically-inducible protein OsmY